MISGNGTDSLLECHNLMKSYTSNGNTIPVLQGIQFTVKRGEIIVIRGRSGAGKSTLIELLGGLSRQNSGTILFENRAMENLSGEELALLRRKKIGIIFQSFNLIPSWTAYENVEAALMHNGISKSDSHERVTTLFDRVGLKEKLDYLPSELSVGQQQRVAIARALANNPILLLADEPTGEVDFDTSQEIIDVVLTSIKEKNVAVVVTTHGNFPLNIADRVLELRDGVILDGH